MSSVDDEWLALQENENKARNEYNQRYNKVKSKSKVQSLTALMNGTLTVASSTQGATNKSSKLKSSSSESLKLTHNLTNKDSSTTTKLSELSIEESSFIVASSSSILPSSKHQLSTTELMTKLSRELNNAIAEESSLRRQGLMKIYQILLFQQQSSINSLSNTNVTASATIDYEIPSSVYNEIFSDTCKIFFKSFSTDTVVKCRELSLLIIIGFFQNVRDYSLILGFYFPCLFQRLILGHSYDENLKIFVNSIADHEAFLRGRAVDRQDHLVSNSGSNVGGSSNTLSSDSNTTTTSSNTTNGAISSSVFKFIESSEEIRLLLCRSLTLLIQRTLRLNSISLLFPYIQDIMLCLQYQVHDPYPEIKMEICAIFEYMAHACYSSQHIAVLSQYPHGNNEGIEEPLTKKMLNSIDSSSELLPVMKYYCVGIIRVIIPILKHKHAKIRILSVKTIQSLIMIPDTAKMKGAGTDTIADLVGFQESNVLQIAAFYKPTISYNYLADLVQDPVVTVREALATMLVAFLVDLPDRFDHQTRLLPYLLDLVIDEIPSVSGIALQGLISCGKRYEEEHREEVLEKKQYGVDGNLHVNLDKPLPYPLSTLNNTMYVKASTTSTTSTASTAVITTHTKYENRQIKWTRPSLGVRLYTRGNTGRFLHALLNELSNWQAKTRYKSTQLLKVIIILCEEYLTGQSVSQSVSR